MKSLIFEKGNWLYNNAFPLYRPLYHFYKAMTDRAERVIISNNIGHADVAVDVGANIGVYSRFLARSVGTDGTVHSFEPSPDNFVRLQAATSNYSNVRLNQAAVGECSGAAKLYVSEALNVDHRVFVERGESRHAVPIACIALDDYFDVGSRVDFIKMDIQGYELHAVRGAKRVIQENAELKLLLELWPYGLKAAGGHWMELVEVLCDAGMTVREVVQDGLRPLDHARVQEAKEWYTNVFASRD